MGAEDVETGAVGEEVFAGSSALSEGGGELSREAQAPRPRQRASDRERDRKRAVCFIGLPPCLL